jgi:uncharacterized protein (TIGR03437 family)
VTTDQTAAIEASGGGVTQTFSLNLLAPARLSAVSCVPETLGAGQSATCTVTLTKAATSPVMVALSSSLPVLSIPASVTIGTGAVDTGFLTQAGMPAAASDVTLTASMSNSSTQKTLRVLAVAAPNIKAPLQVDARAALPLQFEITAEDPQGLSVSLSVTGLPPGASFNGTTRQFTWTPYVTQAGTYTLTVTATNSAGASSTQQTRIRILREEADILGIQNAADIQSSNFCSPGSWVALFGAGFTTLDPMVAEVVPLPTSLGGVQVQVNDSPVPLMYASESQINFQCPRLPIGSAIQVTVKTETGFTSLAYSGTMREATPALFTLDYSGSGQGVVLIADSNELAMPTTEAIPSRPARRGESLTIYANGLGEVQEEVAVGSPTPLDHPVGMKYAVRVLLGGVAISPDFAGLAPGTIGIYQINVPVTTEVPIGLAVPLRVEVTLGDGSILSSNEVTVAIEESPPDN